MSNAQSTSPESTRTKTWSVSANEQRNDRIIGDVCVFAGDLLGPALTSIGRLLRMPSGCGEQNMIRFAPNVYILSYLQATKQTTPDILAQAVDSLTQGLSLILPLVVVPAPILEERGGDANHLCYESVVKRRLTNQTYSILEECQS